MFRVGAGHDTHRLADGYPLILGGVRIDHPQGLVVHSDADTMLQAVTAALTGGSGRRQNLHGHKGTRHRSPS